MTETTTTTETMPAPPRRHSLATAASGLYASPRRASISKVARRPKERRKRPAFLNLHDDGDSIIDIGLASTATASRLLEDRGFSPSSRQFDRTYTLQWAAREGETAIVRMLLNMWHGADISPPPSATLPGAKKVADSLDNLDWATDGWTPLHSAASHGHAAVVELLLDYGNGIDINARTKNGCTPLHWAARNGHLGVVRTLLRRKADITVQTLEGSTAMDWAELHRHQDVMTLLMFYAAPKTARPF